MSIVPTPDTVEQLGKLAQTELPPVPKVRVFACGGCGTNLVSRIEGGVASLADVQYFDTSLANRLGANIDPAKFTVLAGGRGSGGERIANFDEIRQSLTNLTDDAIGLSDINIVVFSAAGGSGSVIGPVLLSDLRRRAQGRRQDIRMVAVVVGDSQSQVAANNTKRTLQTLRMLAEDQESGFYLPVMIFTNKVGRSRVDATLKYRLNALVEMLTLPVLEVDYADRMNTIGPARLIGAASGIRLLHVGYGVQTVTADGHSVQESGFTLENVVDSGEVFTYPKTGRVDTLLSLALRSDKGFTLVDTSIQARVRFDGQFATTQTRPMLLMVTSDDQALTALIVEIEDTIAAFETTASSGGSSIDLGGGVKKGAFAF